MDQEKALSKAMMDTGLELRSQVCHQRHQQQKMLACVLQYTGSQMVLRHKFNPGFQGVKKSLPNF